jgi:hypothetical protein
VTGRGAYGYRFGPLERRSLVGGAGAAQLLPAVAALLLAVLVLDLSPTPAGLLGAVTLLAGGIALARLTLLGRPGLEWALVGVGHLWRRTTGHTLVLSSGHRHGHRLTMGTVVRPEWTRLPYLNHVELEEMELGGRGVGVLADRREGLAVAALACRASPLSLLDAEARERRLRGWGTLLETIAGGSLRRLQWIERTLPAQGDDLTRWVGEQRDPTLPEEGGAMLQSYLELISSSTRVAQEHEVLLALQVPARRCARGAGEVSPVALGEQLDAVQQLLQAAEIQVLGALGQAHLSLLMRTAWDPFARAEAGMGGRVAPVERERHTPAGPAPAAVRETWGELACDGALHVTYWIAGWPRTEVSPLFLDALLGPSSLVRAVSVCFEPMGPERSAREVEAALTRDRADQQVRARLGQIETARHRQAQEAALRREQELAAGHTEVRFSGFVTVSGRDGEELRRATQEVHEQAARARLQLRRLYGQQGEAFTFTLPLCRGLG